MNETTSSCLWGHRWSGWSAPLRNENIFESWQERVCCACGKVDQRKLTFSHPSHQGLCK